MSLSASNFGLLVLGLSRQSNFSSMLSLPCSIVSPKLKLLKTHGTAFIKTGNMHNISSHI